MQFTIRTALIGITFCVLVVAVITLLISQARLTSRIESMHRSHGILTDHLAEDRIEMTSVGPGLAANAGAQIIRIENHKKYVLKVDFIYGTQLGNSSAQQILELNLPQYAITYDEPHRQLFVQSTSNPWNGDDYRVDVPFDGELVSLSPSETRHVITDAPILAVLFGDSSTVDKAFFQSGSFDDLVDFCQSKQYNAVTFTLVER